MPYLPVLPCLSSICNARSPKSIAKVRHLDFPASRWEGARAQVRELSKGRLELLRPHFSSGMVCG